MSYKKILSNIITTEANTNNLPLRLKVLCVKTLELFFVVKKNIFDYDFYDFVKKYVNQKINTKSK